MSLEIIFVARSRVVFVARYPSDRGGPPLTLSECVEQAYLTPVMSASVSLALKKFLSCDHVIHTLE